MTTKTRRVFRLACRSLWVLSLFALFALGSAARAQDTLLFCNNPEKMRMSGTYADSRLQAGRTYTIFYHYKNVTSSRGPLVIALHGANGKPFNLTVRQGTGDPDRDPPTVGKQAMARYLSGVEKPLRASKGYARFAMPFPAKHTASGILTVRCDTDTRLRIYLRHSKWDVPGANVIAVDAPRRDIDIALTQEAKQQFFRIGEPEAGMSRHLDGTYGLLYAFKVDAPEGSRVRVSFSPRGGKAGLVGSLNGILRQSRIIPATHWRVFCEATVGKNGLILTTSPFGGVFYPVELMFQLI